jgi:catechol 2,3-dioxygenase-like lactoylglutathione lyase family enzyme
MERLFIRQFRPISAIVFLCAANFCLFGATIIIAQEQVTRPPITGIAQVQVYVTNPEKAAAFYETSLGYAPAPSGCSKQIVACLCVSSRQQIQLIAAPSPVPGNLIAKVAFASPDVEQMRRYLISKGYAPDSVSSSEDGDKYFTVRDPEGHAISFVQSPSRSVAALAPGQISTRLIHAGFIVHDRRAEDHFYKDVLGFHLYWQGGMKDNEVSWVSMQVPDGTDWLEYMLNVPPDASSHVIGIMNHIALGVADIQATKQQLLRNGGEPGAEPKLGRDGKWQLNLYDPDDTRIEFMEFKPKEKPCCSPFTGEHPMP